MANYTTEQEAFWTEEFGADYRDRNADTALMAGKIAMFASALRGAAGLGSVCEFGCNIGLNLQALSMLRPDLTLKGIEINAASAEAARRLGVATISTRSILEELDDEGRFDLTFTSGVLIHINPDHLTTVYDNLVRLSRRYVLVYEYYNPTPVTVPYRGHEDRLFKRDFAGDLMDRHGLELVGYDFLYARDPAAMHSDSTWFLLRKPV